MEPEDLETRLAEGRDRGDRGDYKGALEILQTACEEAPDNAEVWYWCGWAYYRLEKYEECIQYCDRALEIRPEYPLALARRGLAYQQIEQQEKAKEDFEQAIQIEPQNYEDWRGRGIALHGLEKYEEAIASYDKTLEINPDDSYAWNNRGLSLDHLKRYEEAIASYDKALEIKPDYCTAWNDRGLSLDHLKRYEEAIASYDKALEINPDYYYAWDNRGLSLDHLKRYEEAIASYDKALEINSDDSYAWDNRGTSLDHLKRYEEAIASYDKALEIKSDYYSAWNGRGIVLCDKLGLYNEALGSFNQAIKIKPDYYSAWHNRGVALSHLERYEEAIASYDKALEIKPDDYSAWHNRGVALSNIQRYEEAIASYDKSLEINSDYYYAWHNRGLSLDHLKRYEEAIASYNKALEIEPSDEKSWQGWHQLVRDRKDPFSHWLKAKEFCNKILDSLSFTDSPEKYIIILQQLLKLCNYLGDKQTFQQRIEQGNRQLAQLLRDTEDRQKIELARKFAPFSQLRVDRQANSNNPQDIIKALNIAEQRKNTCLHWLQKGWVYNLPETTYSEIQQLLQPQTALIYWHISPVAITTFILKHNADPKILPYPKSRNIKQDTGVAFWRSPIKPYPPALEQLQRFEKWLQDWENDYKNYDPQKQKTPNERKLTPWFRDMDLRLNQLYDILNIKELALYLQEIDRLILIPHRQLHLLPLHKLFNHRTVTHLPSARIGHYLQKNLSNNNQDRENIPVSSSLLNIEQANELPFAFLEAETLNLFFPNNKTYRGEQVTHANIIEAIANNQGIFHFTGHAYHNINNPLQSALVLANEQEFTLEDIFHNETLQLSNYFLICLSACETGITSQQNLIDEYVGLVSGFLKMGANYVLSTLWTVEERATGLLLSQFYHRYQQTQDPAKALKESQNWLKQATHQDIADWYRDLANRFLKTDRPQKLQRFLAREATREAELAKIDKFTHPYKNPYYWAAFILTGIH
ncbi:MULTISPECIES: tetratricopeptide repeat protein [Spirulina sp. CCY15215]|uniref:CHAT domain-containing protein n=1 Tax=Spirulina sp. CCY15215 TaxID=2767591 RepID=UPI00194F9604|nr:tetratricopeptide repeat protein [Spirulina major]